jgi:hypothetical protein
MPLYRQAILIFGLILPLTIALASVVASYLLKSKLEDSFRNNIASYKSTDDVRRASLAIESKVIHQRPIMERWNTLLSQEAANTVLTKLDAIISEFPATEIQRVSFTPSSAKTGFGSAQKSSQVQFVLRGTFNTVQRAFLKLETQLPQLQLQDLVIDPKSSSSSLLTYTVTYTAWEN